MWALVCLGMADWFWVWFTGRQQVWGQFPIDPDAQPTGLTGAEWIVIVLGLMKILEVLIRIAEVVFKLTPSDADDTWLAKAKVCFEWLKSVLSKLGVGCLLLAAMALSLLSGCNLSAPLPSPQPRPAPAAIAKIAGPIESTPGLPVILDASQSVGDILDWQTDQPSVDADQGRRLILVPAQGRHLIKLTVWSGGPPLSRARAEHVLTVGSPGPTPPGPVPPVPPGPVPPGPQPPAPTPGPLPPGKYQLAQWAHDNAMRSVNSVGRADQAKKLAEACRSVSSAINAGTLTIVEAASQASQQFDSVLGSESDQWAVWKADLFAHLKSKFGLMGDVKEFGIVLDELATGLEAVR